MLLQLAELEKLATQAEVPEPQTVSYERQPAKPRRDPAEAFAKLPVQEIIVIEPAEVKAEPARPPVVAPALARVANGGYASAGLIAWVVAAKYLDHQPLFRQAQQFARWGAELSRQTMVEWISQASNWTEPIYKLMRKKLLASGYIQVDETPIRYHDPSAKKGHTEQGYFWSLSAPGGDVVFEWQDSRRPEENRVDTPARLAASRRARPASGRVAQVPPRAGLPIPAEPVGPPLVAHLEHGRTRIDNNCAENTLRPAKLGMKNWLFIGHPDAGQRSAILYSLVISCKRHGKDPLAYLRDVLTRLPAMTNQDDLDPLLPSNWTPPTSPA